MKRLALLSLLATWCFTFCSLKKAEYVRPPQLPYPPREMAAYLQLQADSSEFLWFADLKAAASSFCNEEIADAGGLSTADIVIVNEGLFHATVEAHLPTRVLILTMERAFKDRGEKSIWQVLKMEEKVGGKPG